MHCVYCMQRRIERKPTISLRLSAKLLEEVDALVAQTRMKSRTEFLERAIEGYLHDIRESKVIVVRPWTEAKAKAAVVKYLRGNRTAYVSEIAEALGMDFELAFRVVGRLMKEGIVGGTS